MLAQGFLYLFNLNLNSARIDDVIFPPDNSKLYFSLPSMPFTFLNSALSFVSRGPSQTKGASMIRHPSSLSDTFTLSNGSYQPLAAPPLSLRRAICERVSVIPYVLQTAFGNDCNAFESESSIAPTYYQMFYPSQALGFFWNLQGIIDL